MNYKRFFSLMSRLFNLSYCNVLISFPSWFIFSVLWFISGVSWFIPSHVWLTPVQLTRFFFVASLQGLDLLTLLLDIYRS